MFPCLSARGGHIIGACTLLIIFILSTRTLWNKNNNGKKTKNNNNESAHTQLGDAHVCINEIISLLASRRFVVSPKRRTRKDDVGMTYLAGDVYTSHS